MTGSQGDSPSPALMAEWDDVHATVRDRLVAYLRELGASVRTCDYVAGLRLYQRAPFLLTLWVADRRERGELTYDLVTHVVAMKLFDDLLDGDSDLDRYELGGCLPLWSVATESLCRRARDPRHVLRVLRDDFVTISTGQLRTKREPARDLTEWQTHANTYGGRFLGCYGSLAAVAGNVTDALRAATDLGFAFGMIVTIADDLRDFERKGERQGNLGHLLRTDATTVAEVVDLVEQMRTLGRTAARSGSAAHDAAPVVDRYADDVRHRMLPMVMPA
jgi:hypothetical protein